MRRLGMLAALLWAISGASAQAQTLVPITPTISGNQLSAHIVFGGVSADFTVTYEDVSGLTASAVSLSAGIVSPAALAPRLPANVTVPSMFPLLIRYEPVPGSALSFTGLARVQIHTANLAYGSHSPYRLFRAPSGAASFADITGGLDMGSIRACGSSPGFSDYLVVADRRPLDSVIASKYDAVQATLSANQSLILATVFDALQALLTLSRTLCAILNLNGAVDAVLAFVDLVVLESGTVIPNVFNADGTGLGNVAGALRSQAETLKYSLTLKAGSGLLGL